MTGKRPERVAKWLVEAAAQPLTFYGIIARRWLGDPSPFDWTPPVLTEERLTMLTERTAGRRAIALLQVGMNVRAGRELRFMTHDGGRELTEALIAIANQATLPMVSLRAGFALPDDDVSIRIAALYPVPAWQPREGFRVDRALLFAFMRQESAFNVRARSSAGARGLMQLMPATASFVAQKGFRGNGRNELYDPALN
ncbi:MAG: transglycosylase SLT domain-containing protein, partial [Alphaproteobacteria bacterium]|nr:transglycosylase SLT domain-containing protein [Alphaproteobacteria bacterium]